MKRFFAAVICIAGFSFPLVQCGDKNNDSYRFVVVAYKGTCSGYYILNDDDTVYFDVKSATGSGSYYSFSQGLESPTTITICVNAEEVADGSGTVTTACPSSITVYIYSNDKIVKQQTFNRESKSTYNNNTEKYEYTYYIDGSLTYEFSDSDSTTSTTSTSSAE